MSTTNYIRGNTNKIDNIPIYDGQVLIDTERKIQYLDNGVERFIIGSQPDAVINTTSTNSIENQAVGNAIIDDMATIKTTTSPLKIAGALALKEASVPIDISSQITFQYTWTGKEYSTFYKIGNVVYVGLVLQNGLNPSPINQIFATGFPSPKKNFNVVAWRTNSNGTTVGYVPLSIYTDGVLRINGGLGFQDFVRCTFSYVTD